MKIVLILFIVLYLLNSCDDNDSNKYQSNINQAAPQSLSDSPHLSLNSIDLDDYSGYFYRYIITSRVNQIDSIDGLLPQILAYVSFTNDVFPEILELTSFGQDRLFLTDNKKWHFNAILLTDVTENYPSWYFRESDELDSVPILDFERFDNIRFESSDYTLGDTVRVFWDNASDEKIVASFYYLVNEETQNQGDQTPNWVLVNEVDDNDGIFEITPELIQTFNLQGASSIDLYMRLQKFNKSEHDINGFDILQANLINTELITNYKL